MISIKDFLRYTLGFFTIIVGIDKFLFFLPTCSLTQASSGTEMVVIGVIEIILGLLLLFDKKVVATLYITIALMVLAIAAHVQIGTRDIAFAVAGLISSVVLLFLIKQQERVELS